MASSVLPALPKAWKSGSVRGLRGRDGYEIKIAWSEQKVSEVALQLFAKTSKVCFLRFPPNTRVTQIKNGDKEVPFIFHLDAGMVELTVEPKQTYQFSFL